MHPRRLGHLPLGPRQQRLPPAQLGSLVPPERELLDRGEDGRAAVQAAGELVERLDVGLLGEGALLVVGGEVGGEGAGEGEAGVDGGEGGGRAGVLVGGTGERREGEWGGERAVTGAGALSAGGWVEVMIGVMLTWNACW